MQRNTILQCNDTQVFIQLGDVYLMGAKSPGVHQKGILRFGGKAVPIRFKDYVFAKHEGHTAWLSSAASVVPHSIHTFSNSAISVSRISPQLQS